MAVLPAVAPIMRSRSRRLGEDTAEFFSIPYLVSEERLPFGAPLMVGGTHTGSVITRSADAIKAEPEIKAGPAIRRTYLPHFLFIYYTRVITKQRTRARVNHA